MSYENIQYHSIKYGARHGPFFIMNDVSLVEFQLSVGLTTVAHQAVARLYPDGYDTESTYCGRGFRVERVGRVEGDRAEGSGRFRV